MNQQVKGAKFSYQTILLKSSPFSWLGTEIIIAIPHYFQIVLK